jgi:DNA-binding GntR family transcriptional regulator
MPIREASRRLAAENALEIAANGSAHVPSVSRERLDDLCRARILIEGLAAELAVPHIRPSDIARLKALVLEHEIMARSGSLVEMLGKNQEFHFLLYRASHSEVLVQLIETLWLRFGPYMRTLSRHVDPILKSENGDTYTEHHHQALAGLKAGDASAVRQAIVEDITATQELLRELCDEG